MEHRADRRRTGDTVAIAGGYQDNATYRGRPSQRFWHQTRFAHSLELLAPAPGDRVLDAGCGSGVFASIVAEREGVDVTGIDANEAAIAFCTRKYANPRLHFMQRAVDELDFEAQRFDKIVFLEVIEHVYRHQAEGLLGAFLRLLKPGGRLVVSTPNARSPWPVVEKAMDLLRLAPRMEGEQHVAGYSPASLRALCEGRGFRQIESRAVLLLSPWLAGVSWRLSQAIERLERRSPVPAGCLLIASFEKVGE
jgi:2-polyprenyl-3-methyl-5-hydroxy-6-metoxy-1,4-benzoquinol methylase